MVFLVVVPILAGLRQLPRPADDRRARRRVPAAQRDVVLVLRLRRADALPRASSRPAARPSAAGRATRRSPRRSTRRGTASTSGSSSLHLLTIASLAGAINFIATIHNMRARRDDVDAAAALRLDDRGLRGDAHLRAAGAVGRPDDAAARPPRGHALLRPERRAAARSSGSTSSGSSATPRSTS